VYIHLLGDDGYKWTQTFGRIEGVLATPEPVAMLTELGGSSIDWSVRVWANTPDYWAVREKVTQAVKDTLDKAGIGIPFPQMDVHLDGIEFSEE